MVSRLAPWWDGLMTNLSNAFVCSDHPGACLCEAAKALASACERECYFVLFHCFCDRDRALFVPTQCAWNAPMRPISARPALTVFPPSWPRTLPSDAIWLSLLLIVARTIFPPSAPWMQAPTSAIKHTPHMLSTMPP